MYLLTAARWCANIANFMNLISNPVNPQFLTSGVAVTNLVLLSLSVRLGGPL